MEDLTGEYSDLVTLRANLNAQGVPVAGATLAFSMDGNSVGTAATGPDGWASLPLRTIANPGQRSLAVRFTGTTTHLASQAQARYTVVPEKATLEYTGATVLSYKTAVLTAFVRQEEDGALGDLSQNAEVEFTLRRGSDGSLVKQVRVPINTDGIATVAVPDLANQSHTVQATLVSAHFVASAATAAIAPSREHGEITVAPPTGVKTGSNFVVPVRLVGVTDVRSAFVILKYDPTRLKAVRVISGTIIEGVSLRKSFDSATGRVYYLTALTGPASFSGDGTLFQVEFQAVQAGTASLQVLSGDPFGPLWGEAGYESPILGSGSVQVTN